MSGLVDAFARFEYALRQNQLNPADYCVQAKDDNARFRLETALKADPAIVQTLWRPTAVVGLTEVHGIRIR